LALGEAKQLRAYSQLQAPVCSFPDIVSYSSEQRWIRAKRFGIT